MDGRDAASANRTVLPAARSGPFSLAQTCGPVAWGRGRWPNVDWVDGALVWVGWEAGRVVWRRVVEQTGGLAVDGSADPGLDSSWAAAVLGTAVGCPPFDDPVLTELRLRFAGLRPFAYGSLFDGLVSSIVGQSISVSAAAVTEQRLASLFAGEIRLNGRAFWPLPRPEDLASASPALVRTSGVTGRRAEALVAVGDRFARGWRPEAGAADRDAVLLALRALPLVGPWTADSALLWGVADGDAYPRRDVALLRAARVAYDRPGLEHAELDAMSD
ncbi:MAG: hypothetical protein M3Q10_02180, partial [Chloroflexota bacterium]|nr:hypothetical protein [Chloroflexota bacterium]